MRKYRTLYFLSIYTFWSLCGTIFMHYITPPLPTEAILGWFMIIFMGMMIGAGCFLIYIVSSGKM